MKSNQAHQVAYVYTFEEEEFSSFLISFIAHNEVRKVYYELEEYEYADETIINIMERKFAEEKYDEVAILISSLYIEANVDRPGPLRSSTHNRDFIWFIHEFIQDYKDIADEEFHNRAYPI